MKNRRMRTKKKNILRNILKIIIFVILSIGAIKIGVMGGNALSEANPEFIKDIDTETFKQALNYSLPLINMVYNSGHLSVSVSGEIKNVIKKVFSFDLDSPMTILNAQSPMLYSYYYNSYQPNIALDNTGPEPDDNKNNGYDTQVPDNVDIRGDAMNKEELPPTDSSITNDTPGESTDKNNTGDKGEPPEEKITTNGKVLVQQVEGTNFKIDIDALLKEPLKIKFDKTGPKVLIYHTHTTESYLKNINEINVKGIPVRTTDSRYNVLRAGDELSKWLKEYGVGTIHNGTNHIEKTDDGCYERSLNTITNVIKGNSSVKLLFDVHRDAMGENSKMRKTVKINGKNAAQIMFVVGTNKNLPHPNWKENLKLAVKLQKYLEDNYPGITRPIYISKNRYNANVSTGALILEVGGDGNTIDEAAESMKYVAKAVSEVIK